MEGYAVRYKLYGVPNTVFFETLFQYMNWRDVLIENLGEWFRIERIDDLSRIATKS